MADPRPLRRKEKLMKLFERRGIRPSTRRGQNFLLDKNQIHFIVRQGQVAPEDVILEVGPGTGFMTQVLADTGCTVLAVELDRKLHELVAQDMAERPNVIVLSADILARKNEINPEVLQRLVALRDARGPEAPLKCVSNLPYAAGTPFVMNLFRSPLPWTRCAFLLQWEVARRMVAVPGEKDYGTLGITAALGGTVAIARKVPPQVFWPRPKVSSAVVTIDFAPPEKRLALPWPSLRRVTSAVFNARRKRLRNALKGVFAKERLDAILQEEGLDPDARGATLEPMQFLALAWRLAREEHGEA